MPVEITATLGDLVAEDPRRSRVLEKFGLDYCCHGHRSLTDAATEAGLNLTEIGDALDLPQQPDAKPPRTPGNNAALAHDIVDSHHAYMWEEMPRLQALVYKVHTVHGSRHPELAEVKDLYTQMVTALEPHMTTEERQVFPAISRAEKGQITPAPGQFAEPIAKLRTEHEAVGELLKKIRSLTNEYTPPEDGCTSYRMMLSGLEEMELDLHEHIHKENNILFPRVLAFEQQAH